MAESQGERLARLEERTEHITERLEIILRHVEDLQRQSQNVRGGIVLITALGGIITMAFNFWDKIGGIFHK